MAVELRQVADDGSFDAIFPDWSELSFNQDFAPGSLSFTYATTGRNYGLFDHGTEVVLLLDGVETADARFMLIESSGSHLAEQDLFATRQFNLNSLRSKFDQLLVAPAFGSTFSDPDAFNFVNVTPGQMVITAIDNAMARAGIRVTPTAYLSAGHPVTWLNNAMGFSPTVDSNGVAWPTHYDWDAGGYYTVTDVLNWLSDNGFAYPQMQGHTLNLYATLGTDLTTVAEPVVLATGRDFTDASYQDSSAELVNALLCIGDVPAIPAGGSSQACAWVYDQDSIDRYGYREATRSLPGLTTNAKLAQVGHNLLTWMARPRYSFTYGQGITSGNGGGLLQANHTRPFLDFQVGDTILVLDGNAVLTERVRSLGANWPDAFNPSVSLTLNDWFTERQTEFDLRLSRLGG